ncbi:MAG: mechanosensitive ion channel family protein [Acidimicrobiales bacterium]
MAQLVPTPGPDEPTPPAEPSGTPNFDRDAPDFEGTTEEVEEGALRLWETVLESLPRLGIALSFVVAGWLVSRGVRIALHRYLLRRSTTSFAQVMSKLGGWVLLTATIFIAIALTFPSVKPVDLLAGLGFFSVAVGFAFQDILENTLSGVLLLFRQPFRIGDAIAVGDDGEAAELSGIVQAITIRETRIVTLDGRLVVIPNRDVYKSAIFVLDATEFRRVAFTVGVAHGTDLTKARRLAAEAVAQVDEVDTTALEPEVLVTSLGPSTIDLEIRVWSRPRGRDLTHVRGRAAEATKVAFDDAGIEMPSAIVALETPGLERAMEHLARNGHRDPKA